MCRLHHLTLVLALILSLLAPTMVCALPNAQMTAQEHACCQKMKGNCGSMRMPASHSCCQQSMRAQFDSSAARIGLRAGRRGHRRPALTHNVRFALAEFRTRKPGAAFAAYLSASNCFRFKNLGPLLSRFYGAVA